ncbi:MAG: lysylphosphatidylglycerol synthase domain-containing protein [Acetobacter peroxydans]|jgi:phosphatidylglycerol lysyltransferase|nr:lysylphosphatidylglycerol synthase domain-containing protein [Acetobacter peroxydans]MCI2009049.1 lysylphosphatidylglycerol synthase domain-containing protein [Acetobacter peroxydans]MCI2078052.1 lysylphosphatidylglycerol synthase domain-containing protein [Acetobacter peroxydans]
MTQRVPLPPEQQDMDRPTPPDLHCEAGGARRWLRHLPALLGLVLMVAAIGVVWHEVRHLHMADIRQAMAGIPSWQMGLAVACTLLSYFVLSFYDRLALIQVGYGHLPFRRAAFAAFCSYVLSHNLGFSAVSGAAVRYRLYRNWGVDSFAITQIIAFCSATYLLGAAALIGAVLIWEPTMLPGIGGHVPSGLLAVIGLGLWGAVALYIGLAFRLPSVCVGQWRVNLPSPRMALLQTLVATAEVAATASIAYVLLPVGVGMDFGSFLAIYIAAYTAGLVASVPGGLGVFDGVMLLALGPYMQAPRILGVILIFRLLYYIIPLFAAGLMFAGHELFLRGDAALARKNNASLSGTAAVARRPSQVVRESEATFSVAVATGTVSLCGVLLIGLVLFDHAPGQSMLPEDLAGVLHLGGTYLLSLMGVALISMAIGLSQRVTLAWRGALALLLLATVLTFLRGNAVFVPVVLGLSTLFIAPYRACYYRHARLLSEPLSTGTLLSLLLLLGCVVALATRDDLSASWWQVVFSSSISGAVRWTVALAVLLALVIVGRLLWPARVAVSPWGEDALRRYQTLPHALADMNCFQPEGYVMGEAGEAMIPLRALGGFLVGLGDPAGGETDSISAIWRMRDLALQQGLKPAFWCVGESFLRIYDDIGLSIWPVGDESGLSFCYPSADIGLASQHARLYREQCMADRAHPSS